MLIAKIFRKVAKDLSLVSVHDDFVFGFRFLQTCLFRYIDRLVIVNFFVIFSLLSLSTKDRGRDLCQDLLTIKIFRFFSISIYLTKQIVNIPAST